MANLESYFASYGEYHKTKGNKLTHYAGIPLIMFSTLGLLSVISVLSINLGLVVWLASTIFYLKLDWKRALPFSVITFLMYYLSLFVPMSIHWALFIGGWILQGIGHYVYEKKSPAFLTNLSHLLIGPFWIYCSLTQSNRK